MNVKTNRQQKFRSLVREVANVVGFIAFGLLAIDYLLQTEDSAARAAFLKFFICALIAWQFFLRCYRQYNS